MIYNYNIFPKRSKLNKRKNISFTMNNTRAYTLSATIIGFLLIDDLTATEQNALGGWLMLVAQILQTNAFAQQNIEQKIMGVPININSKEAKNGGNPINNNYLNNDDIKTLKKNLEDIRKQLNKN